MPKGRHYFTDNSDIVSEIATVSVSVFGRELAFYTDNGVFSKDGLDKGTLLLLNTLPQLSGKVCDLGCGWGAAGVSLAIEYPDTRVYMYDVNPRAVELSKMNIDRLGARNAAAYVSDVLENSGEIDFDFVISNPPIRAGNAVLLRFFAQSHERLKLGGEFYCVIRKQQGAASSQKRIAEIFGNCEVVEKKSGYWILKAVKL